MGLIRILLFLMVAWLAWRLYRNWQAKLKAPPSTTPLPRESMVKCEVCGVHVPEQQALHHEGLHFCSTEHRRRHLEAKE